MKKLSFFKLLSVVVTLLLSSSVYGQRRVISIIDLVELQSTDYLQVLLPIESINDYNLRIREGVKSMFLYNNESDHLLLPHCDIDLQYDKEINSPVLEDFSEDNRGLHNFFDALKRSDTNIVRVGVIGDSFIEGDIFTQALRDILQSKIGGSGVGFVPTTSVASGYRSTVKHTFSGWDTHYIKRQKSFSEDTKHILSAYYATPNSCSASVNYNFKIRDKIDRVKYFYKTPNSTKITIKINNTIVDTVSVKGSKRMQMFEFKDDNIAVGSINIKVDNCAGFCSYGVSHESSSGVVVDNFSDRASSGINMSKISDNISCDFDSLSGGYSLIVVQYGLNVMYSGNNNYKHYEDRMVNVVEQLKKVHPNASIIVMGVSQRKIKKGGVYQLMGEVESMERYQRAVAERTGTLFWSTRNAMINSGGIEIFLQNGWIARDFTHISTKGGGVLAEKFVNSLAHSLKSY